MTDTVKKAELTNEWAAKGETTKCYTEGNVVKTVLGLVGTGVVFTLEGCVVAGAPSGGYGIELSPNTTGNGAGEQIAIYKINQPSTGYTINEGLYTFGNLINTVGQAAGVASDITDTVVGAQVATRMSKAQSYAIKQNANANLVRSIGSMKRDSGMGQYYRGLGDYYSKKGDAEIIRAGGGNGGNHGGNRKTPQKKAKSKVGQSQGQGRNQHRR